MTRNEPGEDINELTVAELRERASEHEITGRSSMNKAELRQAVVDAEEQLAQIEGSSGEEKGDGKPRAETKGDEESERSAKQEDGESAGSDMAAPSIGPYTKIEKKPPEERLAKHEQSDVDAMGLDKRRSVAGGRYGPSLAKQATLYGAFLVALVAFLVGGKLAADKLDQGPETVEVQAPWAQPDASQRPPRPIDFPRNPSP